MPLYVKSKSPPIPGGYLVAPGDDDDDAPILFPAGLSGSMEMLLELKISQ